MNDTCQYCKGRGCHCCMKPAVKRVPLHEERDTIYGPGGSFVMSEPAKTYSLDAFDGQALPPDDRKASCDTCEHQLASIDEGPCADCISDDSYPGYLDAHEDVDVLEIKTLPFSSEEIEREKALYEGKREYKRIIDHHTGIPMPDPAVEALMIESAARANISDLMRGESSGRSTATEVQQLVDAANEREMLDDGTILSRELTSEEKAIPSNWAGKALAKVSGMDAVTPDSPTREVYHDVVNPQAFIEGIKDSGCRTEFDTGAVRDGRTGKGRFDLMPMLAMFRLAMHYERGCLKYGDRNWEKGIPVSKYIDSAIRHIFKYLCGFADEHHLTSALWNIASCMDTIDRIKMGVLPESLNDLPETFKDVDYKRFEEILSRLL